MSIILEAKQLNRTFGAVFAAKDINVAIHAGEMVGIIGSNGAGKTTFVNMVTGYIKPTSGSIAFAGHDVTALSPKEMTRLGLVRSFQVPQLFTSLTVADNLLLAFGADKARGFPMWSPLETQERADATSDLIRRFGIEEYADAVVAAVPQGIRKLLDIAMALARQPRLILLDEPTSGVAIEEKLDLMETVVSVLKSFQATAIFIEHDMEIVEKYASRVLAFFDGCIIADGPPDIALQDPTVRKCIIGESLVTRQDGHA